MPLVVKGDPIFHEKAPPRSCETASYDMFSIAGLKSTMEASKRM
jgi:hypothetical protein